MVRIRDDGLPAGFLAPVDEYHTVRFAVSDEGIGTLTLNRPEKLNAFNTQMMKDLIAVFDETDRDDNVRGVIVTGAGRAFCAGADLRGEGNSAGEFPGTFWEKPTQNSFESGWEIFKPVIAAVNGHCIGYGFTLVTWCDFVIASERATFGFPEVRIGVPTIVGAIRLPQRIGWQRAMEVLLTGERFTAEQAVEMGIALRAVPHDTLLDEANALADRLLAGAPLAQRVIKEMATRAPSMSPIEAIRFGETMRKVASATEDAREGGRAFSEGRPPRWQGR
jgi:E-phenylitaconyl-CoA hydratase